MYDITEEQAYKLANGTLVAASDVTAVTVYRAGGALYGSREDARQSLITGAFGVIDAATADIAAAAVQNANSDDAQRVRYAILYLANVMQGAA